MKKNVLVLAVVAMLLLLLAAVAWDSVRLAADARHRVALADAEMQKHEERLVKLLSGSDKVTPEVQSAILAYEAADNMQTRQDAYDKLVASFWHAMSNQIDPTNPLARKLMDDIAGAINRRDVAQKQYDVESKAYQETLNGVRGRVARLFSAQARADWKAGG
jgi:hypothetical protein